MIADRIKLARHKAGLSLRDLSAAMHGRVTAQAIGNYERGEDTPSPAVVTALAQALGVSPAYLHDTSTITLSGVEFRTQANTTARDRTHVEVEVIEWLERYLQVERILDLDSAHWHAPVLQHPLTSIQEAEHLADVVRSAWHLGEKPIPNMTELLEEQGLKVLTTALPDRVSGFKCLVQPGDAQDALPAIVVNQQHSLERRRLTMAHELAHCLIDTTALSDKDEEKAANWFAGALLMPRIHVLREVGEHRTALGYQELIDLKHLYRVSGAALLMRLKVLGVITESVLTYAFQSVARGWRTQEPEPLEPAAQRGHHESAQRFHRLCYRALAEGLITVDSAAHLLRSTALHVQAGLKGPQPARAVHP